VCTWKLPRYGLVLQVRRERKIAAGQCGGKSFAAAALETVAEGFIELAEMERLLRPETPATPERLCDQAILELAYASGLRLSELKESAAGAIAFGSGFYHGHREGQ
jgi:integrase